MTNKVFEFYDWAMSKGDVRTRDWMFVNCPVLIVAGLIGYLVLLRVINSVMEKRQAFDLKNFLIAYNLFQVVVSLYIFAEVAIVAYQSNYNLTGEAVDYSTKKLPMRMAYAMYYYYVLKIVDLADTILFALRKKKTQITFLHVFHHFSMVINAWLGIMYVAGGQTFMTVMLNSLVHGFMYAYYGLAAMGPSMRKHLWWKKYITQMQLVQFAIIVTHAVTGMLNPKCTYPSGFSMAFIGYGCLFAFLFSNFYSHSYKKPDANGHVANGHAKSNGHHHTTTHHDKSNGIVKQNGSASKHD